jgi:DNA-binding GntR family transcriptional regulator
MDESEITNIYDLRGVLEGYAAAAAARRVTPAQLSELERLAQEMCELVETETETLVEEISEMNNRFHKLIVSASHNSRLQSALSSIVEMPLVLRTFRRYDLVELRRSTNQHAEIVSALAAHDADWARSVMTSHIRSALHTLLHHARSELNGSGISGL